MTALGASLAPITEAPIELVARRRFSRLSAADERALEHERREARANQTRLRAETRERHPEWFA